MNSKQTQVASYKLCMGSHPDTMITVSLEGALAKPRTKNNGMSQGFLHMAHICSHHHPTLNFMYGLSLVR